MRGWIVGSKEVNISHLQYADNTDFLFGQVKCFEELVTCDLSLFGLLGS